MSRRVLVQACAAASILVSGLFLMGRSAPADSFAGARYDAKTDELVVRMQYRGTNPNHNFSVRWGQCRQTDQGATLDADVLDDQARDVERQSYTKTVRLDLSALACRPVRLTLRTAPRFFYQVVIPDREP